MASHSPPAPCAPPVAAVSQAAEHLPQTPGNHFTIHDAQDRTQWTVAARLLKPSALADACYVPANAVAALTPPQRPTQRRSPTLVAKRAPIVSYASPFRAVVPSCGCEAHCHQRAPLEDARTRRDWHAGDQVPAARISRMHFVHHPHFFSRQC